MDPTKLQYIGQTKPLIKSLRMQYINRAAAKCSRNKNSPCRKQGGMYKISEENFLPFLATDLCQHF